MKQKLFDDKKYSKLCKNCFFGRSTKEKDIVLCEKKGVVDPDGKCTHYKYDPLKRVPEKTKLISDYSEEDFKL